MRLRHAACPSQRQLQSVAGVAWRGMHDRGIELSIRVVGRREMRGLNTRYRGKRKGTDVLTFPYLNDGALWGGDIVIGREQALRQARARRVSVADECTRLVVHGLCHLAGYHHHSLTAFGIMRKIEFETLIRVLSR